MPSQMTFVFLSFSFSGPDAHQTLMAATHRSTVFLASCASATGADDRPTDSYSGFHACIVVRSQAIVDNRLCNRRTDGDSIYHVKTI